VQAESTKRQEILSWRVALLTDAGFSAETAGRLACDRRYDLHALLELVDHGCPLELAVRIVRRSKQTRSGHADARKPRAGLA
jgi:hypothetical protein